jgi:hypothetical protein
LRRVPLGGSASAATFRPIFPSLGAPDRQPQERPAPVDRVRRHALGRQVVEAPLNLGDRQPGELGLPQPGDDVGRPVPVAAGRERRLPRRRRVGQQVFHDVPDGKVLRRYRPGGLQFGA